MKKIIYLDMDDTLCDYKAQYKAYQKDYPDIEFPQSINGFFETMVPKDNALEVAQRLFENQLYQVYILTAPSLYNPICYTEKRIWVEKHLGFKWVERLIISFNKGLLKGDYLVDDYVSGRGQENFEGKVIHFGSEQFRDWQNVSNFFKSIAER
jgi:5'-nucleotidase